MEISESKKIKDNKFLQLKIVFLRYYGIVIFLFIIIIIASSYYFILNPKYQEARVGGRYNLNSLQQELNKRSSYLTDLKLLDSNYKKISSSSIEKMKMILPEERDIAGIFVQLEHLAQENGIFLAGISVNETESDDRNIQISEKGRAKRLSISLNLISVNENGDYREIKNFLSSLENNLRLFDVNAVYFSPTSPNYSINLFAYYYEK